ncbi:opsin-1, short-wave-sensitive 2 isoform X2 [Thalassophryne amazonica]|uniref:opsin-1, short-wave-sensitive 2 isoform X2 n=1 Tax=Thalassophryne amazonica TaxID=390379 RepID=UPI0014709BFA|nr:opsin-1, short-wave-sensitive 2 isoform X2 [Thalassophryne amazonica]
MRSTRGTELPEDFWIPIPLDTNNITALSPFLVPQDHLGSTTTFYAMAVFMFFVFIFGTGINALTIACTIQYKKLRSHLNYILVNLAVANLIVSCVGSFTACCSFAARYFVMGALACKIEGFMATLGGMVSLWSLAVIAFERWLVICKPLGNFVFKPDYAVACCIFTWVFALLAAAPPLFGWSRYIPEGLQCSCGPDCVIVFCYSQLLITLKLAAKAQAESVSTQKAEREVTRMVVIMVLGFLVCWLPYTSFSLWVVSNRGQQFDLRLATIPSCFSKSSAVYNPIIYILLNKQFRSCMMAMLGMGEGEEKTSSQSVTEVSKVGPA